MTNLCILEYQKKITDFIVSQGSIVHPITYFIGYFSDMLVNSGVVFGSELVKCMNVSISLTHCLKSTGNWIDYVFLSNDNPNTYFNGAESHFDIRLGDRTVRYTLISFISMNSESKYSCFTLYSDTPYEICDTKITQLTPSSFLTMSRSASMMIFKLSSSVCDSDAIRPPVSDSIQTKSDIYDFEAQPVYRKKKFQNSYLPAAKRKKVIKIDDSFKVNNPDESWLDASQLGRLDLTSCQRKKCESHKSWYDDIIMNSYARMCQLYFKNSFIFQDTCLGNINLLGNFSSVDQKFIQIILVDENHWICVSNALTFINEPAVVEIFDSKSTDNSLRSVQTMYPLLSRFILQIKPLTNCIRYIKTQYQANNYDCGPWALGFMWALAKGHSPTMYEHLIPSIIRNKVIQSFETNSFKPPCLTSPRHIPKCILKTFNLDNRTKEFVS